MTDEEVFDNHEIEWIRSSIQKYDLFLKSLSINDLIQIVRYGKENIKTISELTSACELRSRIIPEELKLEVLLLLGD